MRSNQAPSVAAKIAAVHQRYEAARQQMRDAERMELEQLQQECGSAGHHWKWHQVAGDGRYCTICDLQDTSAD